MHRASRRRLQRRNARIELLQELFAEEICKVDPGFYQRLEDSKFYIEDKKIAEKYTLFIELNITTKTIIDNSYNISFKSSINKRERI